MILNIKTTEICIDLREAYDDIEAIWANNKLNRNEQALIAIGVLIAYGVDRKRPICGAMKRLGFKPSHAAVMLTKSAGNNPERHHWNCNSAGIYSLLGAAKAA
tara:strand:- start:179 stop:487 length:309 start_codon:yes stop_codon:yes gene_type:complete